MCILKLRIAQNTCEDHNAFLCHTRGGGWARGPSEHSPGPRVRPPPPSPSTHGGESQSIMFDS